MTAAGGDQVSVRGGPWWWERRRSAALDVGLAALSALECGAEGVSFAREAGIPPAAGVVLGMSAGSVLAVRRRWPAAVVVVAVAVTPAEMGFLLSVVGLYSLAASESPRRVIGSLAAVSLLGTLIATLVRTGQAAPRDPVPESWVVPFASVTMAVGLTAPPLLAGLYVGARRRLMESLRERADSLERELQLLAERAEERAEWARDEERRRIAREMHDVVAHRVSLMVVHAAALQAVVGKDPEKAALNAGLVGEMGRQALTELREMLGVLRAGAGAAGAGARASSAVASDGVAVAEDGPRPGGTPAEPLPEGPGLDDLRELVGQSAAAGMAVDLSLHGERRSYAPEVEQTAFRVVQEALTNAHKHAAGARTRVRVAYRLSELATQVENEPPPGVGPVGSAGLPSGGNGLVGMRERVSALGGVFVSGPTDEGGFRVSAVIPSD
ncbi:sensor histidine kinase [Streptomyces sp. WMMC905]|uniref:sensor histidine kinase n=1 Tax=Streptomyces sp. WMMC905 TaxID=3404123 RepID=UPI003B9557DA